MGHRGFEIDLVQYRPDGSLSELNRDLAKDRAAIVKGLDRLTNEFVHTARKLPWRGNAEGSWIVFPLGGNIALCQWQPGQPELWHLGVGRGMLKVVRILGPAELQRLLDSHEDDE
jgi:hypothetical protein